MTLHYVKIVLAGLAALCAVSFVASAWWYFGKVWALRFITRHK